MSQVLPLFSHTLVGAEGAPVVTFVPGIGNDEGFWAAQAKALSEQFRVLTFAPWGHGDSPAPPSDAISFQTCLDGVLNLWDALGIEKSSLVGLGFGGSTCLALGLHAPQRVEKIVACCCRPRQPDDRRDFWRGRRETALTDYPKLADATVDRWLSDEFRASHPQVDKLLRDAMHKVTVEGYRAYVNAFIDMDFDAQLEQLKVPTLLLAGEHDHGGGPVPDMEKMHARIPGSRFRVVKNAGHIIPHEQPAEVTQLLQDFLRN